MVTTPSTPVMQPFRGWLRLQAALSATALFVVWVRSAQLVHSAGGGGAPAPWRSVVATQSAFWLGWSVWAGALVPLV